MFDVDARDGDDCLADYGDDIDDRRMLQEKYNSIFERNMDNFC